MNQKQRLPIKQKHSSHGTFSWEAFLGMNPSHHGHGGESAYGTHCMPCFLWRQEKCILLWMLMTKLLTKTIVQKNIHVTKHVTCTDIFQSLKEHGSSITHYIDINKLCTDIAASTLFVSHKLIPYKLHTWHGCGITLILFFLKIFP